MCGISGFFYKEAERPIERDILDRMTDIMAHRGPDARGTFVGPGGGLGHRRLTIIDLIGGQQPMVAKNQRSVLVFNGEIYNYKELAQTYFADEPFRSSSDTEVLLEMLQRMGLDSIPRLNGMFAFAYWTLDDQKVYFARDPAGQKPLFYTFTPHLFAFASELSGVAMHPEVPLEIDTRALGKYLAFEGYPHPESAIQNVRKLRPGHCLVLDLKKWKLEENRYWFSVPTSVELGKPRSEDEVLEAFDTQFKAAVDRHYRSDVKVGIFLSAGLDSNAIVRAAVELKGPEAIQTFTIRHADPSFNEADEAKVTATHYGLRHHERLLTEDDILGNVRGLLDSLDEPLADPGYLSISQVIRFAKEHVTVTLGGDGGDEYYAGYAPFQALRAYQLAHRILPQRAASAIERLAAIPRVSHTYMNNLFKLQRFMRGVSAEPAEVAMRWMGAFSPEEVAKVVAPGVIDDASYIYEDLYPEFDRLSDKDLGTLLLHFFQQFYLPISICGHADKASMAVSQELRSPFLDVEMMKFANSLPMHFKYRHGQTKYLLRRYHRKGPLPEIASRRKRGFTIPIAKWLMTSLKPWAEDLLDPRQLENVGMFDVTQVRRLWSEHQSLKANHAKSLWTILVFQHWYNQTLKDWKEKR